MVGLQTCALYPVSPSFHFNELLKFSRILIINEYYTILLLKDFIAGLFFEIGSCVAQAVL